MFTQNLRLQKPLEDFIDWREKLNPRSVGLLSGMVMPEAVFEDPYVRAQGFEKIEAMFTERLKFYPKCRIHDFSWGRREGSAYLFWSCGDLDGTSMVSLLPDGKIIGVTEFWGAHEVPRAYKKFKL